MEKERKLQITYQVWVAYGNESVLDSEWSYRSQAYARQSLVHSPAMGAYAYIMCLYAPY